MDEQLLTHTFRWVFQALHVGVVVVDHHGTYLFANPEARRLLTLDDTDLTHRHIWDDIPQFAERLLARAVRTGGSLNEVGHWLSRDQWLRVSVQGTENTASMLLVDISEHEQAHRRASSLLALATTLARATTQDEVIQVVVEEALRTLGGAAGSVLLLNLTRDALTLVGHVGFEQEPVGPWSFVAISADIPVTEAVRLRHPVFIRNFDEFTRRYPRLAIQVRSAYVARAALPLVSDRKILGVLALSFTTERAFDDAEQSFLVALAGHCAQALGRAAAFDRSRDDLERLVAERTAQFQQLSVELGEQVQILEERNQETQILADTSEILQSCLTSAEVYQVLFQQSRHVMGNRSCVAYELSPSRNVLEEAARWAEAEESTLTFAPDECWGLRRSRPFMTSGSDNEVRCAHVGSQGSSTMCIPFVAQGETLGLLHFTDTTGTGFSDRDLRITQALANLVGAAILNLRLRESLRQQSIRDSLTGLFNRRYLEETFERELRRAQRLKQTIGVVMLDVDHFKRFNDAHGHDAGDVILQHFGKVLQANIRAEDVACRYGGEEFALVLPGVTLEQTHGRAEALRQLVQSLQVSHKTARLGPITASFGVAAYPANGTDMKEVVQAADMALYVAKQSGRNRVHTAVQAGSAPKSGR